MVEISSCAAAIVVSARSRPIAESAIDPRWLRNDVGGKVSGAQTSAPPAGNRSASGGSTPTIVRRSVPSCSERPTTAGSPPKCERQNRWPSITLDGPP